MPEAMAPMLATAAELPLAGSGWLLEPKLDGYRTLAFVRRLEYESVRAFAHTISGYLEKKHPREVTLKWPVVERPGKVFVDYNQNARGKTLASVYSPRPTVAATVSIPFRWEELDEVYPTDFTILNTPQRLAKTGDIWADMLKARNDIKGLLESGDNK
jgi:bifunctional non-homologous end joining protein LigD